MKGVTARASPHISPFFLCIVLGVTGGNAPLSGPMLRPWGVDITYRRAPGGLGEQR